MKAVTLRPYRGDLCCINCGTAEGALFELEQDDVPQPLIICWACWEEPLRAVEPCEGCGEPPLYCRCGEDEDALREELEAEADANDVYATEEDA